MEPKKQTPTMSLQKAVDMGEYDPHYLSTFPEWQTLTKYMQFQFVKTGIENRKKQLLQQYAAVNNVLDFRLKPELKQTLDNILKLIKDLDNTLEVFTREFFK